MREDMDSLREKALKASPGPWRAASLVNGYVVLGSKITRGPSFRRVATVGSSAAHADLKLEHAANAAYIAACDPQTILTLIDEVDRLRAALRAARGAITSGFNTVGAVKQIDEALAARLAHEDADARP